MTPQQTLKDLETELLSAVQNAGSLDALESVRVGALGKQGRVSQLMKTLGTLSPEERKEKGQIYNELRQTIASALEKRKQDLEEAVLNQRLKVETVDVTLPTRPEAEGTIHPLSQTIHQVIQIFKRMGFDVAEGPEIEDDFHNFTALNVPADHPAREEQDTFYLPPRQGGAPPVLRTQTSPVQIRTMEKTKPPLAIIAPGRVFRCDSDATHTPNFHQVEGLWIDKKIHMGHLKGCLIDFCQTFFEVEDLPVRFRPAFFPFTEPSAEMEIGCTRTASETKIGKGGDWLEILGCGMVHPNVLSGCGIDPEEYQGLAFGVGLERITMLKYGIPDLRDFYEGDIRWLSHYGFSIVNALAQEEKAA